MSIYRTFHQSIYRTLCGLNYVLQARYNHKGYHAVAVYINALNNAILRANVNPKTKGNPAAYGKCNYKMDATCERCCNI